MLNIKCRDCTLRWYGFFELSIARWFCRKDLKAKRGQLRLIGEYGTDANLKSAKGCKDGVK